MSTKTSDNRAITPIAGAGQARRRAGMTSTTSTRAAVALLERALAAEVVSRCADAHCEICSEPVDRAA